jgi:two-component system chemotaxis sensor kinase CheA
MSLHDQLDPEILADFITETSELLESLDRDLVTLEHHPADLDLLNNIFRALHTVKGASSFLALAPLTEFAHAAEDALNALRKGQVKVTTGVMDHLLMASDVLRRQVDQVKNNEMPDHGPAELIAGLKRIGEGHPDDDGQTTAAPATAEPAAAAATDNAMLQMASSKLDLLPYMIDDLLDSLQQVSELVEQSLTPENLERIAIQLKDVTSGMVRTADFFEIDVICNEVRALDQFSHALPGLDEPGLLQARPRVCALIDILRERATALRDHKLLDMPTDMLVERLCANLVGRALDQAASIAESASTADILRLDGVLANEPPAGATGGATNLGGEMPTLSGMMTDGEASADNRKSSGEQTIRVDVERLEMLLNLVGELVLQKNRVSALSRRAHSMKVDHEFAESFGQVASDLDRVTSELQLGVMKTRMQPLSKLFSRYPRLIRDLARSTDKQIDLRILGGETEVDKSVIELLGDPLVHILRNSGDHGIETPQDRIAAGKSPMGTIEISACHEGNHVLVKISDDGRGLDPIKIGRKAVEKGLTTTEELATLSEAAIFRFIFAPGFSTAAVVSDLSGRGVGMDVVKTNIAKMNGMVDVDSVVGQGTTVSIKIPLTVAIMQAMMVGVEPSTYAIPLSNILEIVKPQPGQVLTIDRKPVIRLRETVLPLVNLGTLLSKEPIDFSGVCYIVVIGMGTDKRGLIVDRVLGQEEVVIKPLEDDLFENTDLVSGATVREDGGISLILDMAAMVRQA